MDPASPNAARFPTPVQLAGLLAVALIVLTATAYWPGLSGPFLFDDLGSLGDLGRYGGIDDWDSFVQFVFGGLTGPTGRPLALLTFLIDGRDWPTDPWPFKRTNLVIHCLTSLLIAASAWNVLRITGRKGRHAVAIAVVAALCWALHPFLVSTVLYPVQRMAQLAAMFCIAGFLLYAIGRQQCAESPRKAYATMSVGVTLGTALAVISKENGALLPLLILVFEYTVVAASPRSLPRLKTAWLALFLLLPAALVIGYFLRIAMTHDLTAQLPMRGFSMIERLLTETRILVDYLRQLLLPSLYTSGIFQDGIAKSTGLLQPVSTLLATLLHAGLIATAWLVRRRAALLSFAVLFFYVGHLVESTYFNLELYFEHRNYLPAAFLFLPIAAWVAEQLPRRSAVAVAVVATALLFGFTRYSATIWSDYDRMVEAAAQAAPNSERAQQQYSLLLFNRGETDLAESVTDRALERNPSSQDLNVWRLLLRCRTGRLSRADFNDVVLRLTAQPYDLRNLQLFETTLDAFASESCPVVDAADMQTLIDVFLAYPLNADPARPMFAQLSYLRGVALLYSGRPDAALADFRASLASRAGAGRAMRMAAIAASVSEFDVALELSSRALDYFGEDGEQRGESTGVSRADIEAFRQQVREHMQVADGNEAAGLN